MKKLIVSAITIASMFLFSCGNSGTTVNKTTDTTSGNTDSSGSQPVQTSPGAANGGNATDTIGRQNDQKLRTDSVVRH